MRKIIALLLIVSIMLSFAIISSAQADVTYLYGDVDNSGEIDDIDAMLLSRYLAGWPDINIDLNLADGNGDGFVDDIDDMLMTRYLAQWDQSNVDGFRYGTPFILEYVANLTINNPNELELGTSMTIDYDLVVDPVPDTEEEPIVTFFYQSSNTAISAYDDTFEAVKMGESVVTIRVVAYYPEAGITANGYTTHTINVVDTQSTMFDIVSEGVANFYVNSLPASADYYKDYFVEQVALKTGVIMENIYEPSHATIVFAIDASPTNLRSGGYQIRVSGNILWVEAIDEEGMDKAVRYLLKYYLDETEGTFAVPDDINVVEAEGYAVKSLTINGVDISEYTIIIPSDRNDNVTAENAVDPVESAGGMLRRYIEIMTGYTLDVRNDSTGYENIIEIKVDDTGKMADEAFNIKVVDGTLTITGGAGGQERGVLYGAMDLIENYLGVRFVIAGSYDTEHFYECKHIEIPNGFNYSAEPGMEYRHMTGLGGTIYSNQFEGDNKNSEEYYTMPLKQNGGYRLDKFGRGYYTTFYHAHSFEEQFKGTLGADGQLVNPMNQPCLTKRGQSDICWNSIVGLIEERMGDYNLDPANQWKLDGLFNRQPGEPELMWISVAWNDNENYCNCSQCRKVVTEEGSISGPLVRLANDMADRLAAHEEYYPIKIFTIGYGTTARKPTKTALRDNITLCYCWNGCNNHPFTGEECDDRGCRGLHYNNIKDREFYEGWVDISSETHIWYYSSSYSWRLSPLPILENIYYDFKYLADVGCNGIYAESGAGNNPLAKLTNYMMARAIWDPYMEYEEYMDMAAEYVRVNFGDGWEYIMEFIEMWDESSEGQDCWLTNYSHPYEMMSMDYYAENYDYINELLYKAESMANTEEQQYNIQVTRIMPEFFALSGMYDDMYVNGDAEAQEWYAECYTNLYNFIKDNGIDIGGNGGNSRMTAEPCNPMKVWYDFPTYATWY